MSDPQPPQTIVVWQPPTTPKPGAPPTYDQGLLGTLMPHPDNPAMYAVKLADGLYFTVTPEGTYRHDPAQDTAHGPWQAFQVCVGSFYLIASRGDGRVYQVPYSVYAGPATP